MSSWQIKDNVVVDMGSDRRTGSVHLADQGQRGCGQWNQTEGLEASSWQTKDNVAAESNQTEGLEASTSQTKDNVAADSGIRPKDWKCPCGRPRTTWLQTVESNRRTGSVQLADQGQRGCGQWNQTEGLEASSWQTKDNVAAYS